MMYVCLYDAYAVTIVGGGFSLCSSRGREGEGKGEKHSAGVLYKKRRFHVLMPILRS